MNELTDRILILDDELDILNLAKRMLERAGYQVATTSDSEELLRKADSEKPDLILLDVVVPGKSGLEICKVLKSQPKTKHVPVVMFTALGRDVDRKLGLEAGANGHFTKPFTADTLSAEIKKHLDQGRAEKFSKQLGIEHSRLHGRKLLLEFDPSTPYERVIRDFALECAAHSEDVVVLTKRGSTIRQAVEGEAGIDCIDLTPDLMLSPILEKHAGHSMGLIYDSLTDLALSTNSHTVYKFASSAIELLSEEGLTAVFLLNSAAHDQKDTYSLKGLFSNQVSYGRDGVTSVRVS